MTEPAVQDSPTRGVSYLYMAAACVIVVAGMRAAEPILNPLLLAIMLAVISSPAYFALLRRKFSNWLALLIVIGGLSAIVLSVALVVRGSVSGFISRQTHYQGLWDERTRGLETRLMKFVPGWMQKDKKNEVVEPGQPDPQQPEELPQNEDVPADPKPTTPATPDDATQPPDSDATATTDADADSEGDAEADVPADGTAVEDDAESVTSAAPTRLFPRAESPQDQQDSAAYMSDKFTLGTLISWVKDFSLNMALSIALSIPHLLSNGFLILLTVIFILLETGTFTRKIRMAFSHDGHAADRAQEIITSMRNYIVIKTWVSLGTGILIAAWLWFLGVPFYALWGLLAFLFNFIPNIGSIIAAVPAVVIAWLELTTLPAVAAAIGFVLVNGIVGNFLEPRLMGKGLGLSPLVVFFSMVFWGWVLGPVGMLLSVPLTITARIALDGFEDTRWVATLLGNAENA